MIGGDDTRRRHPLARLTRLAAHLLIVALVFGVCLWAFVVAPPAVQQPLRKLDLLVYDWNVSHLPTHKADPKIVIVGMDDDTLTQIKGLERPFYPLPRICHARVVDELRRAGAKVIGFDIMFRDPSPDDAAFAAALERHGNVVAALAPDIREDKTGESAVFHPITPTLRRHLIPASIVVPTEVFNRVRWLNPYQNDANAPGVRYEHLSFALIAAYFGEGRTDPMVRGDTFRWGRHIVAPLVNDSEDVLLRYAGPPSTFGYVSYADVYNGTWRTRRPASYFHNAIVIIGAMQPLTDRHDTPFGGNMAGVELLAQGAQMVLHADYLRAAPPIDTAWAAAILTLLLILILRASGSGFVPVAAALLGALWVMATQQCLIHMGLWVPTVQPIAGLVFGSALVLAYEAFHARSVLRRFVPNWAADRALQANTLRTRSTERQMTVVFCDVRNSVTLGETLPKEWLEALMRRYWEAADEAARRQGTELDKYLGDGLMLYFHDDGGPLRRRKEPHPVRALRWAIEMQDAADRIHRSGAAKDVGFRIGIGIATGAALEGLVGGQRRVQATVIGDVVNVASRLQEMTKTLKRPILMNEAAYSAVKDAIACEPLGAQHVKGRQELVEVYSPLREVSAT